MTQNQFVDALKLFLDTAEPGELENLAVRLKPYRITSLHVQRPDGAPNSRSIPVIVLDDGRKTPEPTPSIQQHLESIMAASQSTMQTPAPIPKTLESMLSIPTLPASLDAFFDFNSLPWPSTNPSCLTAPGNMGFSIEDMILDDDQLGDFSAEFSMPGTPGYYHPMQDTTIAITPHYPEIFDSGSGPSTFFSNDPYGSPSTFLDTPINSPSPSSSDAGGCLSTYIPIPPNTPTMTPAHIDSTPVTPIPPTAQPSPTSSYSAPRAQAKINRRRNHNNSSSSRPRRQHPTAASITQAILSSSAASHSPTRSSSSSSCRPDHTTAALVFSSCIRKDYVDFLRTNLPEWVRQGLWRSSSPLNNNNKSATGAGNNKSNRPCFMTMGNNAAKGQENNRSLGMPSYGGGNGSSSSTYGFLENIYSCVSQLDSRIETDQVRKRVALVLLHSEYLESYQDWKATRQQQQQTLNPINNDSNKGGGPIVVAGNTVKGGVGRGDMTLMIDNILEQTTPGWEDLSPKRKLQLRALFHERKRYGKRWAVFREEVGCAILLVCSGQLGNMVSNTKVTMAALKGIAQAIRDSPPIMEVLSVLEPLAEALVNNEGYRAFGNTAAACTKRGYDGGQGEGSSSSVEQMMRRFEELPAQSKSGGGPVSFDGSMCSSTGSVSVSAGENSGGSCSSDDEDME